MSFVLLSSHLRKILKYDSKPRLSHKTLLLGEFKMNTTCVQTYLQCNKLA